MWLIVGLGNPGPEYERTRHNLGFLVVDELERRAGAVAWRSKFGAQLGEASLEGARVLLCKPQEYMNLSGQAVARAATFWKVPAAETVVVHDELDLPFGRLKLGTGGGPGGHNGVRSIIASSVGADFVRVRVGIGRPPPGHDAADYVLAHFSKVEQKDVPALVAEAADAVEAIVASGLVAAMNRYNVKKKS
jgi:PTH1 family peptidyl-tRNA hydrolase